MEAIFLGCLGTVPKTFQNHSIWNFFLSISSKKHCEDTTFHIFAFPPEMSDTSKTNIQAHTITCYTTRTLLANDLKTKYLRIILLHFLTLTDRVMAPTE